MQVWLGTSGYSYGDWIGAFYPPGTRPGRMLPYYSRHFPLVELNFTFYRLPTPAMLARLADQTPESFQFIVKFPRTLSHEENPDDLAPFRLAVEQLAGRGRLLGLLCQLPQASHDDAGRRQWLTTLGDAFAGYRLGVEFRHRSWFHPDVAPWLAERDMDLVAVDVPDIPALYPRGLFQSGPRLYVRFHSRNARNWYASDKERYDYDYSDVELQEWIGQLQSQSDKSDRAMLLFNNCQRSHAVVNAQRMRELIVRQAPDLHLVEPPPAPAEPQQPLLFEGY
jgi:uncharacterized protein YecE (DUF72 family)